MMAMSGSGTGTGLSTPVILIVDGIGTQVHKNTGEIFAENEGK